MELGKEIPIPCLRRLADSSVAPSRIKIETRPSNKVQRLAVPTWVIKTLLGSPSLDPGEMLKLGVYVDFQRGYVYLEPGRGTLRLQDLRELSSFPDTKWDRGIWTSFLLGPVKELLITPLGVSYMAFKIDTERGRIRISHKQGPSDNPRNVTLGQRRKLFL